MDDSYARKFLEDASKLDAISNQAGELTKYASAITNEQERAATIAFCPCLSESSGGFGLFGKACCYFMAEFG